ncbi:hypothetical protein ACIPWL_05035 [Streptomyces sp. NPDC090023]|uniref:hypothetical protein n=1 Tax=unclassified Streptomyces TaxID=2593676 RepID=UPI003804C700
MNEGNPTPDPSPAGTDGDFELAKPAPPDLAGSGAPRAAEDTERRDTADSVGLGFAIPVNQSRRVAEELIRTGHAPHPVIGVTLDMDYAGDGARIDGTGGAGGPGDRLRLTVGRAGAERTVTPRLGASGQN